MAQYWSISRGLKCGFGRGCPTTSHLLYGQHRGRCLENRRCRNFRKNIDGFSKTGTVGAIDVAESDPNVVVVGMGNTLRGIVTSVGDGIYISTDAGKTWEHRGLESVITLPISKFIPLIRILFCGCTRAQYGPTTTRGIYKSTNGGESWKKVSM